MVNFLDTRICRWVAVIGGLVLFVLTATMNLGIIAIDDYAFVVAQIIPAQSNTSEAILKNTGVWHPILPYILHLISEQALEFGITEPYRQLQVVLLFFGITTFVIQVYTLPRFFSNVRQQNISRLLLSFYFIAPLILTRLMIETAAAPLLLISTYFAHRYFHEGKFSQLWLSILTLSVSALVRYQTGVCILALVFLVATKRNLWHWFHFFGAGVSGFLLAGSIDWALTGQFHGSLEGYLNYNLIHSAANHGEQPFYTFLLLFVALTIPPSLISRYAGFEFKKAYSPLCAPLSFFLMFVLAHTLTPHKEERFMIPVLPLFFICLTPLIHYFTLTKKQAWRFWFVVPVNLILLFLTSFSTPQSNILGLVRYLDHTPYIKRVYSVLDTLVIFPSAFSSRSIEHVEMKLFDRESIQSISCSEVVAVRETYKRDSGVDFSHLTRLASFKPGPLESILVRLNPVRNARRGTIDIFGRKGCE